MRSQHIQQILRTFSCSRERHRRGSQSHHTSLLFLRCPPKHEMALSPIPPAVYTTEPEVCETTHTGAAPLARLFSTIYPPPPTLPASSKRPSTRPCPPQQAGDDYRACRPPSSPPATPFRTFGLRTENSITILALKRKRNIRDAHKPCPSPASGGAAAQPKHTGSFVRRTTIEPCRDKREAPHYRTIAGNDSGRGDKHVVRALTLPPIAFSPACMRAAGSAIQQCQGLHA
ncbi:unnamed protein product [Ectocarpus sp. 12 AP-2014]